MVAGLALNASRDPLSCIKPQEVSDLATYTSEDEFTTFCMHTNMQTIFAHLDGCVRATRESMLFCALRCGSLARYNTRRIFLSLSALYDYYRRVVAYSIHVLLALFNADFDLINTYCHSRRPISSRLHLIWSILLVII